MLQTRFVGAIARRSAVSALARSLRAPPRVRARARLRALSFGYRVRSGLAARLHTKSREVGRSASHVGARVYWFTHGHAYAPDHAASERPTSSDDLGKTRRAQPRRTCLHDVARPQPVTVSLLRLPSPPRLLTRDSRSLGYRVSAILVAPVNFGGKLRLTAPPYFWKKNQK